MTDHRDTDTPDVDVPLPAPGCDPVLSDLVRWVDGAAVGWDDDQGAAVVLTVGGTLVRGTLIPASVYADRTDAHIAHEADHDPELIEGDHRGLAQLFIRLLDDGHRYPDHLHLADAQHLTAIGWWPDDGLLWRGRIDAVSGWSHDTTPDPDDD